MAAPQADRPRVVAAPACKMWCRLPACSPGSQDMAAPQADRLPRQSCRAACKLWCRLQAALPGQPGWPHDAAMSKTPITEADFDAYRNVWAPVHSRGELPHLYKDGGFYFVTFRLLDAVHLNQSVPVSQQRSPRNHNGSIRPSSPSPEEIAEYCEPPLRAGSCGLAKARRCPNRHAITPSFRRSKVHPLRLVRHAQPRSHRCRSNGRKFAFGQLAQLEILFVQIDQPPARTEGFSMGARVIQSPHSRPSSL